MGRVSPTSHAHIFDGYSLVARSLIIAGIAFLAYAQTASPQEGKSSTAPASIDSTELADFDENPSAVRSLLERCLALTKQNLGYQYGSSDPKEGVMDCSGTVYFVLQAAGITDVPRTASEQYVWTRKAGTFVPVISRKLDSFEVDALRPGDLLFWTGTYSTDRDPPVTHSMVYLGRRQDNGKRIMFGASDGRSYEGRKIWGVSVFDFTIAQSVQKVFPGDTSKPGSLFIGYAHIPRLE